ncbi:MAG: dTDP-4-dehydrorhamnose 3,5-epimerase family protein [Acidimicrobiales bacterium]
MKFTETDVEGCRIVELQPHGDERGFFARAWCADEMAAEGLANNVAQINMSRSADAGTIRGLHWQIEPHGEAKFVRCIAGKIFDVCVDVRPDSPTYGKWAGVELTPTIVWRFRFRPDVLTVTKR